MSSLAPFISFQSITKTESCPVMPTSDLLSSSSSSSSHSNSLPNPSPAMRSFTLSTSLHPERDVPRSDRPFFTTVIHPQIISSVPPSSTIQFSGSQRTAAEANMGEQFRFPNPNSNATSRHTHMLVPPSASASLPLQGNPMDNLEPGWNRVWQHASEKPSRPPNASTDVSPHQRPSPSTAGSTSGLARTDYNREPGANMMAALNSGPSHFASQNVSSLPSTLVRGLPPVRSFGNWDSGAGLPGGVDMYSGEVADGVRISSGGRVLLHGGQTHLPSGANDLVTADGRVMRFEPAGLPRYDATDGQLRAGRINSIDPTYIPQPFQGPASLPPFPSAHRYSI